MLLQDDNTTLRPAQRENLQQAYNIHLEINVEALAQKRKDNKKYSESQGGSKRKAAVDKQSKKQKGYRRKITEAKASGSLEAVLAAAKNNPAHKNRLERAIKRGFPRDYDFYKEQLQQVEKDWASKRNALQLEKDALAAKAKGWEEKSQKYRDKVHRIKGKYEESLSDHQKEWQTQHESLIKQHDEKHKARLVRLEKEHQQQKDRLESNYRDQLESLQRRLQEANIQIEMLQSDAAKVKQEQDNSRSSQQAPLPPATKDMPLELEYDEDFI